MKPNFCFGKLLGKVVLFINWWSCNLKSNHYFFIPTKTIRMAFCSCVSLKFRKVLISSLDPFVDILSFFIAVPTLWFNLNSSSPCLVFAAQQSFPSSPLECVTPSHVYTGSGGRPCALSAFFSLPWRYAQSFSLLGSQQNAQLPLGLEHRSPGEGLRDTNQLAEGTSSVRLGCRQARKEVRGWDLWRRGDGSGSGAGGLGQAMSLD